MARPAKTLRLAQIRPVDLGREVEEAVLNHVHRLAITLSPGVTVHVSASNGDTTIEQTEKHCYSMAELMRYFGGER